MSDPKKSPVDLLPLRALVGAARVFQHGNTRPKADGSPRAPHDYIERELTGVFYASTLRHTIDLQNLEGGVTAASLAGLDADSGLPKIDHLICNLLMIRTMLIRDGVLPADPGAPKKPALPRGTIAFDPATMYRVGDAVFAKPAPAPLEIDRERFLRVDSPASENELPLECTHPRVDKGDEFNPDRCTTCYAPVFPERIKFTPARHTYDPRTGPTCTMEHPCPPCRTYKNRPQEG